MVALLSMDLAAVPKRLLLMFKKDEGGTRFDSTVDTYGGSIGIHRSINAW